MSFLSGLMVLTFAGALASAGIYTRFKGPGWALDRPAWQRVVGAVVTIGWVATAVALR